MVARTFGWYGNDSNWQMLIADGWLSQRRSQWTFEHRSPCVFHLDKCIGCHTCSIACKNLWTDRKGAEYMWWNNVETKPGTGYPTRWEDQEKYQGGWEVERRQAAAAGHRQDPGLHQHLLQPQPAHHRRLLRALDLRLRGPVRRPARR